MILSKCVCVLIKRNETISSDVFTLVKVHVLVICLEQRVELRECRYLYLCL